MSEHLRLMFSYNFLNFKHYFYCLVKHSVGKTKLLNATDNKGILNLSYCKNIDF